MMSADRELDKFLDRRTALFSQALFNLIRAKFGQANRETALADLAGLIQRTMILADLHGRRRLFIEMDHAIQTRGRFAASSATPIVPNVPFVEAIEDLLFREPRLAKSAEEVARLYSTERVFAMARAAEGNVDDRIAKFRTEWVQRRLAEGIEEGKGIVEMTEAMKELAPWTDAYAGTVYRTNVSNAYTEGRFKQAEDPEVKDIMPAMEIVGIADAEERPNHRAARGMIAATNDSIWDRLKPPLGFQCRHGVRMVSRFELERRGMIDKNGNVTRYEPPGFENARPDEGFR